MKKIAIATIITLGSVQILSAKENVGMPHRNTAPTGGNQVAAACTPSTSRKDLDVNNIRCPIYINGDMWWDLVGNAQYEVPKDSKKYSLFAGALWIGGRDVGGNLKVAAQTYRQSGSDFWPGPVDTIAGVATITADVCSKYDRHWRLTREEVNAFALSNTGGATPITPSKDVKEWPGNGDQAVGQARFLAPFHDEHGDGIYDVADGDYPGYNLNSDPTVPDSMNPNKEYLLGDQTIWWVFNDVGNVHKETGGASIGLEIQAQAFAFATNDEINNMTFYKYKIINRSALSVNQTYFGAWVDPDLGNYLDDYVGCDVKRGFGYCYNGDAYDDGITGYGFNPPAIGYDFFQGPKADAGDGIDNDRDGCKDCTYYINSSGVRDSFPDTVLPELIIMSKFVYYNNNGSPTGNPTSALDYYNYMKGIWKDGTKITYGGNGHGGGLGATTDTCDFMFPGDSDPTHWGTNGISEAVWDEVTAGNAPDDRRFLQSAGPFTLLPGAVNYITTGAVWGRTGSGGPLASVQIIRTADDKAQKLFDHNFAITNGPDAPDLSIRELDKELLFSITNPLGSNNYNETYSEIDPNLSTAAADPRYHFEGYQVFQLKDGSVTTNEIKDLDKARLIFQCDIKNGIGQVVNFFRDPSLGSAFYGVEEVNGTDNGVRHVFRIKKDKFATGDDDLINHKTYYFTVLAYGYNTVESDSFNYNYTTDGDGKPYIAGRRRINTYTAIPHKIAPEANGLILSTSFGDGPQITRLEGSGNGFLTGSDRGALDMTQASVDEIIFNTTNPNRTLHPVYQRARGPVDIRVYDPVRVIGGNFLLWADGVADSSKWYLKNTGTNDTLSSVKTIRYPYDQLIQFKDNNGNPVNYGFYVNLTQILDENFQPVNPGGLVNGTSVSGFVEATIGFEDPNSKWLSGVPDIDNGPFDWIASGKGAKDNYYPSIGSSLGKDGNRVWSKLIGGTWAPYLFTAYDRSYNDNVNYINAPLIDMGSKIHTSYDPSNPNIAVHHFENQSSVDIVFTSDSRYWSKCIVFEEDKDSTKTIGHALKCTPRRSQSLKLSGGSLVPDTGTGYSYFPGYAINVETGERLNIAFGEDSYLNPDSGFAGQTGADMRWNPTSTIADANGHYILGGMHVVYVFAHDNINPMYDSCNTLYSKLKNITKSSGSASSSNSLLSKENFQKPWGTCMWVGFPLLNSGQSLLSNKATVRLRVAKPYIAYQTDTPSVNNGLPMYQFSTGDLVPITGDLETAKSALDLINIVPNPYYSFSSYEKNQLDNRVKIINLPSRCTITIYTPSGTLIRKLIRDVDADNTSEAIYPANNMETALDWDLKNSAGIPIASGVYIIHVEVPGVGEKTIKWFGVLRPIDLDTF
ncbi:MAG: hypothetical protein NT126_06135 [Bacteroidetes bacterium]|nr:hypothetical protein [Bacteroidota bacterium]